MCFGFKMRIVRFICITGLVLSTCYLIFYNLYQSGLINLCSSSNQVIQSNKELKKLIDSFEKRRNNHTYTYTTHLDLEVDETVNLLVADDGGELADKEKNSTREQRLQSLFRCQNRTLIRRTMQYGTFWLMRNVFVGTVSQTLHCAESITYTTHGDFTFVDNLATVVTRWLGPISFALFAPGHDFPTTMDSIQYVRNCLPVSELIRKYVTFHIYFPNNHMPKYLPKTEEEVLKWPFDCIKIAPFTNVNQSQTYRTLKKLIYPVNVGRNIARQAVNTHLIFSCDIELYPSPNFINLFLQMIDRNQSLFLNANRTSNRVFTMPIFELTDNTSIPNSKGDLQALVKNKTAHAFHAKICWNCHKVPGQDNWLKAKDSDKLEVFATGKRLGNFVLWEPTFVSFNQEPYFDERLTWEAQADRRTQAFAMCLLNYEYYVVHPAFLVHRPGIKVYDPKSPRVAMANKLKPFLAKTLQPEYKVMYGDTRGCVT